MVIGERQVIPAEADVIRRICKEYAAGQSSRAIACALNTERVSGPQGRAWGPSTIHGNASLAASLSREDTRADAAEIVRSLASKIELTPEGGKLAITLHGDLASMLAFAANKKKPGAPGEEAGLSVAMGSQLSWVAGACNHLDLLAIVSVVPKLGQKVQVGVN